MKKKEIRPNCIYRGYIRIGPELLAIEASEDLKRLELRQKYKTESVRDLAEVLREEYFNIFPENISAFSKAYQEI